MKKLITLSIFLLVCLGLSAQSRQFTLKGTVSDEKGEPLAGATIVDNRNGNSALTDIDGKFSIDVMAGDKLTVSFLGYFTAISEVKGNDTMDIEMKPDMVNISESTVVGYSRQERRDITGAVSSVKFSEQKPALSIDQLLQGQAPGVFVSNSSGALGAANLVTIRGISSIMGDNNPLYVVDGVPIYSTDRSSNLVGTSGGNVPMISMGGNMAGGGSLEYNYDLKYNYEQNPLMFINPDDIESIEILKDAFATSIYGSRGAAGVILITTRSGGQDKLRVNVSYTLGIDNPIGNYDMLSGPQYSKIYSTYYPSLSFRDTYDTDWVDAVTRTAISHSISANVSGGTDKATYYISLSGDDQQSYIINNGLTRYSLRTNLTTRLNRQWSLGTNTSISNVEKIGRASCRERV